MVKPKRRAINIWFVDAEGTWVRVHRCMSETQLIFLCCILEPKWDVPVTQSLSTGITGKFWLEFLYFQEWDGTSKARNIANRDELGLLDVSSNQLTIILSEWSQQLRYIRRSPANDGCTSAWYSSTIAANMSYSLIPSTSGVHNVTFDCQQRNARRIRANFVAATDWLDLLISFSYNLPRVQDQEPRDVCSWMPFLFKELAHSYPCKKSKKTSDAIVIQLLTTLIANRKPPPNSFAS